MPETKNEPTPAEIEAGAKATCACQSPTPWDEQHDYLKEIYRHEAFAVLAAAAPETKRQRDALEIMLRRMLIDTDHPTEEARALIAECAGEGDAP